MPSILGSRSAGEVAFAYDSESDVLYVWLGTSPREAVAHFDDDDDAVLIRRDPRTHDVVGATILAFSQADSERLARVPFAVDWAAIRSKVL